MAFTVAERQKILRAKRRPVLRKAIRMAKAVACADCRVQYPPYVMDFDHVRGEKRFNIAKAGTGKCPIQVLLAEIQKCDVVCANCHRIRSFKVRAYHNSPIEANIKRL